jgi:hypothetical protein
MLSRAIDINEFAMMSSLDPSTAFDIVKINLLL